ADILREYAGQRVFTTFGRWGDAGIQFLEKRIIRLLYSKSEGLLLARRLKSRNVSAAGNAPVLDLAQSLIPEKKMLQSLPRFYVNLFSSRSSIGSEFYIKREEDEERMRQAVDRYNDGYKGGILVLGERNAGKTAFCKQVTDELFPKKNILHLFAPNEGSTRVEDLARILEQETGLQGTPVEILASLSHETVLVIHDLELWFAQHEEGSEVVQFLVQLMDRFNEKILFIVNCNPHSFSLIDAIEPIRNRFISTIELSPLSTEELKDLILLRHHSSGLHFRWKGRAEKKMSELRLASLFDAYFAFSEGNPGAALNAWLGSILRRTGDTLDIRTPEIPNLTPLRNMDEDMLVILSVFAIHKRLTTAKLARITCLEIPDVEKQMNTLKRCGLIEERGRGSLILNMYLEPFILKVLIEKQVL
ncbi:MAG: AAA family ATPase, partial [Acidobacteriota bacterium]